MSAQTHLMRLYQDWRTWTEAEREAITEGDWRKVKVCQGAKSELQPKILKSTEEAHIEWLQLGLDRKSMEKQLRSVVNELIYLETRNGEFIADQRRRAQIELDSLDQSGRTLVKIQKHYAPEMPAAWESYS
jgi:hypothetical protein